MAQQRRTTTRHVALLRQQVDDGSIVLAAEFQRNSVWPRPAKAHLIDSVIKNRPIPALLFHRTTSTQTGQTIYQVVDGQQRLRAVIDYLNDRFALTDEEGRLEGKRFRDLKGEKEKILNYDFVIEELSGYTEAEIRDIFARVNRYVVKLNQQELRHAKKRGAFAKAAEAIAAWDAWKAVFTPNQRARMRPAEFAAELLILLDEGAQDKKASVDVWYSAYRDSFPEGRALTATLKTYMDWIAALLDPLSESRFSKPTELYGLIGAIDRISEEGNRLSRIDINKARTAIRKFESEVDAADAADVPQGGKDVLRYLVATSQQTDNLRPRLTRIEILESVLSKAAK